MDDMEQLAELSHTIDRVALSLCRDELDDRRIELAVVAMVDQEKEALAVALSYALRRRELEGSTPLNDRAVAALAGAMRRLLNNLNNDREPEGDEGPPDGN